MSRLGALWAGRLPLAEAFWVWAIGVGLMVNVAATALGLGALAAGLPALVAVALHLVPAPANVALAIAVWRSARHYDGPRHWAEGAQVSAIGWAGLLMLV